MPPPLSAGILLFRQREDRLEVLLVKPGGPFWRNKDAGAWMIPKGLVEHGETPVEAALREFEEETGTRLTTVPFPLATVRQAGGKLVEAFALEGDLDAGDHTFTASTFAPQTRSNPLRSDGSVSLDLAPGDVTAIPLPAAFYPGSILLACVALWIGARRLEAKARAHYCSAR